MYELTYSQPATFDRDFETTAFNTTIRRIDLSKLIGSTLSFIKPIVWFILMAALCIFAIMFTSEYFTSLYQVSSSMRASMPSLGLFQIMNMTFWMTLFFAFSV